MLPFDVFSHDLFGGWSGSDAFKCFGCDLLALVVVAGPLPSEFLSPPSSSPFLCSGCGSALRSRFLFGSGVSPLASLIFTTNHLLKLFDSYSSARPFGLCEIPS